MDMTVRLSTPSTPRCSRSIDFCTSMGPTSTSISSFSTVRAPLANTCHPHRGCVDLVREG